jgi:2-C-methyl-D-erythritol 2,4-cyclodiphosphate synthase
LCELAGIPVTPVESLTPNFKLTTPEDVQLAEALAQQLVNLTALAMPPALPFAIGTGYDIHRLVPGRPLVLGGVTFASEVGLDGHSDADVLLHALMDALLGALALGDIGKHFPPSDQRYRGADSRDLLRQVRALLASHGATPINVDATVVAEHPRLAAVVEQMRVNIAADLAIAVDCVSIKATTNEGLGPEGRREGISATAVALVAKQARA